MENTHHPKEKNECFQNLQNTSTIHTDKNRSWKQNFRVFDWRRWKSTFATHWKEGETVELLGFDFLDSNGNHTSCPIVARREVDGSYVYCETSHSLQTLLVLSKPHANWTLPGQFDCVPNTCLRSFGHPSGCVGPIVQNDDLNCRSQLGESRYLPEFWLCCACLFLPQSMCWEGLLT